MSLYELICSRRTIRRFKQKKISNRHLEKIVNAGRLAPSAANLQPLEFIIVDDPQFVQSVFDVTKWAGYLPSKSGRPPAGQEPVAFIINLINRQIRPHGGEHDVGAAIENMILTALENGIGSCWIGSIERDPIRKTLNIPEHYTIDSVLALGYPNEDPIAEPITESIKYYKDMEDRLHVPKRTLETTMHHNTF